MWDDGENPPMNVEEDERVIFNQFNKWVKEFRDFYQWRAAVEAKGCFWCGEPFGTMDPDGHRAVNETQMGHEACLIHMISGSRGHVEKYGFPPVGDDGEEQIPDDPSLTRREAALAAWSLIFDNGKSSKAA
jgi:hypothetical protein